MTLPEVLGLLFVGFAVGYVFRIVIESPEKPAEKPEKRYRWWE